jgi:hypothetical protein
MDEVSGKHAPSAGTHDADKTRPNGESHSNHTACTSTRNYYDLFTVGQYFSNFLLWRPFFLERTVETVGDPPWPKEAMRIQLEPARPGGRNWVKRQPVNTACQTSYHILRDSPGVAICQLKFNVIN